MKAHTITLSKAREIAREFRDRRVSILVADIRDWPVARLRDALLWFQIYDRGPARRVPTFPDFARSREHLRRCRVCGCTEDGACVDPAIGVPCSWIEPDLCSACLGAKS